MGDSTHGIEQFRAAVKANAKEHDVHFGAGFCFGREAPVRRSGSGVQAELDNDPTHAEARAYLGNAIVQLHEYAKAQTEFVKAAAADPTSAMVHFDFGIVFF